MAAHHVPFRLLGDLVRVGAAVGAVAALVGIPSIGMGARFTVLFVDCELGFPWPRAGYLAGCLRCRRRRRMTCSPQIRDPCAAGGGRTGSGPC
jgi:hypothetical protein